MVCFYFLFTFSLELAFITDIQFLAGSDRLYNIIWINRILAMFFLIVMPILISGFGSFIKTVGSVKEDTQNHWPNKKRSNLATLFFFGTVHNQAVVDNTIYLDGMVYILLIVIFIFSVITWFVHKYLLYGTKLLKILTAEVTHEDGKKKEKDSEIVVQFVAKNFRWYYQYLLGLDYLNDINKAIILKNAIEVGNEGAECAILKLGAKGNLAFCTLIIPMNKKIKVLASSEDERSYKWFIPGLRPITIIRAKPGAISTGLLYVKEPGVYRTEFTEVETGLLTPGRTNMVIELKVLTAEEFFVEMNAALAEQMKNESYKMYW
jgi:heme/copper-type cytochrome/quinol oxidase subunit 2